MRPTPLLSTAAAVALLAAVSGPATAATAPVPAKGVASSAVTLLGVTAGGTTVTAGTLELLSDMLGAQTVARILLTPVTAGGTPFGQQTVTPAGSPASAPSLSRDLLGLASLSSPVLRASASDTDGQPSTTAGADSLGGVSLLGVPLALDGSLDVGSVVTRTGGALGTQEVLVEGVALPSIADVLGALGLDLSALPVEVLYELLDELDLVNGAVDTAQDALDDAVAEVQTQVDAAQAQVGAAEAQLAAALDQLAGKQGELAAAEAQLATRTAALAPLQSALTAAQGQLTAANKPLTDATAALNAALAGLGLAAGTPLSGVPLLSQALLAPLYTAVQIAATAAAAPVAAATTAVTTATTNLSQAQSLVDVAAAAVTLVKGAVATLQTTIDGLQDVLDAALDVLDGILDGVQAELTALLGAITAVLDGTPLVSFDSLSILTRSAVTSSTAGGQSAEVVGGELTGLEVLGTDVLTDVLQLDSSSIDLLDLVGSTLAELQSGIGGLTGTLSAVLSSVPGFPALDVPAPQIGLLTKSSSTGIEDGFGLASTAVKGLSVTLPAITLPTALALPGAADLPALAGVDQVAGLLSSAPITLDLATLSSSARFAPAVAGTPGTGTPTTGTPTTGTPTTGTPAAAPQLPRTGASSALAALGVVLMAGAVVARRRRTGLLDDASA